MKLCYRPALAVMLAFTVGGFAFPKHLNPTEIPFRCSRTFGLILVRAEVNGNPASLVFDTGSNQTILSTQFVDIPSIDLRHGLSLEKGSGVQGAGLFTKASLKVGTLVWRDHRIIVMDTKEISQTLGEKIDGTLGMDFLSNFDTVTIDFQHHKLLLE